MPIVATTPQNVNGQQVQVQQVIYPVEQQHYPAAVNVLPTASLTGLAPLGNTLIQTGGLAQIANGSPLRRRYDGFQRGGGLITKMNNDPLGDIEFDQLRKTQYRNDLLGQMEMNASNCFYFKSLVKKHEEKRVHQLADALEDERMARDAIAKKWARPFHSTRSWPTRRKYAS